MLLFVGIFLLDIIIVLVEFVNVFALGKSYLFLGDVDISCNCNFFGEIKLLKLLDEFGLFIIL